MVDRYQQWRREDPEPVLDLSEFERRLFRVLGQEDYNYIYQFKLFLADATEHIAVQLVPIYQRIILATNPDELLDLTEKVFLNPLRWPQNAWNAARHRLRGYAEP